MKEEVTRDNIIIRMKDDIMSIDYRVESSIRFKLSDNKTDEEIEDSLIKGINNFLFGDYKQEILELKHKIHKLREI